MARSLQSRRQLIKILGFNGTWEELVDYADAAHRNRGGLLYREWDQRKSGRARKKRRIEQPLAQLPKLQGALATFLEKRLELHDCVQGSIKGKSSLSNALIHADSDYFMGVDIRRFYPSVRSENVHEIFSEVMSPELAGVATRLCTLKGRLPTGASTSPILGNMVLRGLDSVLLELANKNGLCYSRYVDDLTFSGKSDFSTGIPALILSIVRSHGYTPHFGKVRYQIGTHEVTGVQIKKHRLSPTMSQRKRLTAKKIELGKGVAESVAGMKQYMTRVGEANKRR